MLTESICLGEATRRAIEAAAAGDLIAVSAALADREAAIATATPAERAAALEAGETVGRLMTEIRRNLVAESARLEQLRRAFVEHPQATGINLQA